jgi:hypothetical protein
MNAAAAGRARVIFLVWSFQLATSGRQLAVSRLRVEPIASGSRDRRTTRQTVLGISTFINVSFVEGLGALARASRVSHRLSPELPNG